MNVLLTDRKLATGAAPNLFEAVVTMTSDYYPFGMQMPGRHTQSEDYRYAYNGMEVDNEVSGNGNSYTTEFRQYDPRLGRWKSLDPLMAKFPWMSPYVAFGNNPIYYTDSYGLEPVNSGDDNGPPVNAKVGDKWKNPDSDKTYTYTEGGWMNDALQVMSEVDASPRNQATHDLMRAAMNSGSLDQRKFLDFYKKYWENSLADPNVVTERHLGEYQQAVNAANARKEKNMKYAYGAVVVVMAAPIAVALIETSPLWAPYVSQGATYISSNTIAAVKVYHRLWGMKGGYISAGGNIVGQGIANGGDLTKTNVVSVIGAGFVGSTNTIYQNGFALAVSSGAIVNYDLGGRSSSILTNDPAYSGLTLVNGMVLGPTVGNVFSSPSKAAFMEATSGGVYQKLVESGNERYWNQE